MRASVCLRAFAVTFAVLSAACADDSGPAKTDRGSAGKSFDQSFADVEAYPVFASSEIVVGRSRLLIGLLNDEDAPIASPDISMHVAFYDLSESDERPAFETDAEFLDTGPRGLYVTYPEFDAAGEWGAEVTLEGEVEETVRAGFEVTKKPMTPALGERVPASRTPTAGSRKAIAKISTDDDPDPRFYETSVHEAVRAGRPFVLTFATPKFCTSAVCAPTLDIVKGAAGDWRDVTFIHVEVYENLDDPSNLKPVAAVKEWNLPSEPWVFVVDEGRLVAKYEGSVSTEELGRALEDL